MQECGPYRAGMMMNEQTSTVRLRVAVAVVGGVTALGLVLPPTLVLPRQWHLLLHVVGAVLFLGNGLAGPLWLAFAERAGPRELAFALRVVNVLDVVFTAPGAVLLVLNGVALSVTWGGPFVARWLLVAVVAFALAGLSWSFVLVPQQLELERLASAEAASAEVSPGLRRRLRAYSVAGALTAVPLLTSLTLMVLRPPLT